MKRTIVVSALCLCALQGSTAFGQGIAQPLDPDKRMVLTAKDAVALMPTEVICGPTVLEMAFSDSGRYLLVSRQEMKFTQKTLTQAMATKRPPAIETSIVIWDSQSREVRTLWKATGEAAHVEGLHWLPDTEVALVMAYVSVQPSLAARPAPGSSAVRPVTQQLLLRVVPGSTRAQVIVSTEDFEKDSMNLFVSPSKPLAILQHSMRPEPLQPGEGYFDRLQQSITVLGDDGRLGKTFPISQGYSFWRIEWDASGGPILDGSFRKGTEKPVAKRLAVDTRTGAGTPTDKPAPPPVVSTVDRMTNAKGGIRLKQGSALVKEGPTSLPVGTLWLESIESTEQPRSLVSADSIGGQLSPNGDAILFQSQNTLMAVPLLRVEKAMYIAAKEAATRMQLLNKGKQVALATLMYAQDYDEVMPNGDGIAAKLEPYTKDASLFDGLSYTFGGGPLKDVEKPAETELGYFTGPGGRAIMYIDGHVKWKSDK